MRAHALLAAAVLLVPVVSQARDIKLCADLYRQLNNAPLVIGTTAVTRRYVQDLAQSNSQIRSLRIQMRQAGCGGGSIVTLGGNTNGENGEAASTPDGDQCSQMRQTLQTMENGREAIVDARNKSQQASLQTDYRAPILAAIHQNDCIPDDVQEQDRIDENDRIRIQGLALPKDDPASQEGAAGTRPAPGASASLSPTTVTAGSITSLNTMPAPVPAAPQPPPPPDRPYDPSKKVRMVGPVFLPDDKIDLVHPKQ